MGRQSLPPRPALREEEGGGHAHPGSHNSSKTLSLISRYILDMGGVA